MSYEEDLRRLKNISCEEQINFSCSSCRKEYQSNGAIKYCARCQEYLFIPCMEDTDDLSTQIPEKRQAHDSIHTLNSKMAEDSSRIKGIANERPRSECSVWTCSVNVPVISTVGCTENQSPEGNSVGKYNETTDQVERTMQLMEQAVRELQQAEKRHKDHLDELNQMKKNCLRKIQRFRTEVNETIERLEQAAIAELENTFQEIDKVLHDKLSKIQETLNILRKSNEDVKQDISQNVDSESLCEDVFKTAEPFLTEPDIKHELVFINNTKLLEILQSFHSFGFCEYQEKQDLYHIQSMETKTIRHENDKEDCSIHSCCFIDPGDILLADYKNKNIKVLDGAVYKVKDVLSLNRYPLSVCRVSNTEAAVALAETRHFGSDNCIQFVSTERKLVPTRSIRLEHCCTGISVIRNQLFVSNERKRLFVYNLQGELQTTVHLDQFGNEIFSKSYAITENDNGKMVHVTDLNKGLITLDKEGKLLWKYSGPKIKMAWGVCTDGKGNIFVSGGNSSNVVQIGPGGNYLGEVVSEAHSIKDPQAICFDEKKSRLFVTRYNCNSVYIFSVL
ncbi:uncharacterized protein LOC123550816 [Mercenaria mercenaria]|uniref:uncharacterized protein LOC123550816 n=1 Tax=Mercenaria mercenaria TaxID=6596 RepID=UPI00234EDEAC|nr:uncharacterized protein LOC123550816 [Mercenaria mercenaria]